MLDLLIKLLDALILICLLAFELLLLFLLLLLKRPVLSDVMMQVHLVVLQFFLTVNQRLIAPLLFLFKLFDLLLDSVISQLSQEHLLLLVDELICVLGALLLGELDTTACNMHSLVDMVFLLGIVVAFLVVSFSRRNVSVLDSV